MRAAVGSCTEPGSASEIHRGKPSGALPAAGRGPLRVLIGSPMDSTGLAGRSRTRHGGGKAQAADPDQRAAHPAGLGGVRTIWVRGDPRKRSRLR